MEQKKYAFSGMRYREDDKKQLAEGVYVYDCREWDDPDTDGPGYNIELAVWCNHIGTILTNFPIEELNKVHDYIEDEDFHNKYNPIEFTEDECTALGITK